jgi:uncharacterized protein YjeT (DUF2065 family)
VVCRTRHGSALVMAVTLVLVLRSLVSFPSRARWRRVELNAVQRALANAERTLRTLKVYAVLLGRMDASV